MLLSIVGYFLTKPDSPAPQTKTAPAPVIENHQPPTTNPPTESDTIYAHSDQLTVTEELTGLDIPWDVAFTHDGVMLVNERSGRLIARLANGNVQEIQADWSDLAVRFELGLMGMVVDPDFATKRRLYTCQGDRQVEQVKVVAWHINSDYTVAERVDDPLVGNIPSASVHDGCRLRFDDDGYLWISTGDAAQGASPQNLNSLGGKVLRVDATTGQAAPGNPFNDSAQSRLIYSFGHRNPQGLAWSSDTGQMWLVEHGPDVDDEINLLVKGGNYGWDPVLASGGYHQQAPMTNTTKHPDAIEAQWSSGDPTLATSGAIFLTGDWWGDKENHLAVATLKNKNLYLFEFDDQGQFVDQFMVPELSETYGRLRTPVIGPDNALYLTTSNGNNEDFVLKVTPD